jgi:hypothetical protein
MKVAGSGTLVIVNVTPVAFGPRSVNTEDAFSGKDTHQHALSVIMFPIGELLEYLEAAWPDGELGIMVGQEGSLFAVVAGFVMRMDGHPHDNVIAFGGVQRSDRIHLFQFDVGATRAARVRKKFLLDSLVETTFECGEGMARISCVRRLAFGHTNWNPFCLGKPDSRSLAREQSACDCIPRCPSVSG